MKKEVMIKLIFTFIIFTFLLSGVFAVQTGTCAITTRAACPNNNNNDGTGGYIVMGLAASTNSHGQLSTGTPAYSYVLCCGFSNGATTCTGTNKIIGLSSSTNAHAEIPSSSVYSSANNVCYGDLSCASTTASSCPAGQIGILSLSSTTNAHIGAFADYSTKICCSGTLTFPCTLKSAYWSVDGINPVTSASSSVAAGQIVYLVVKGSGAECNGKSVSFVSSPSVSSNISSVAFNGDTAKAMWNSAWQTSGILGGDASYSFTATLVSDATKTVGSSTPTLTVTKISDATCSGIITCDGYKDANQCNTNSPCDTDINQQGSDVGFDCTQSNSFCQCSWDNSTSTCGFSYGQLQSSTCGNGYTLCQAIGGSYCYPGNACPLTDIPTTNNDSICNAGEGCSSADCNGQQDNCATGLTCSGGMCSSATAPIVDPTCDYGYTTCHKAGTSRNYCYPGNSCPLSDVPLANNNGSCDFGEGCSSIGDCKDGDIDGCSAGLYCSSGKCSSSNQPASLGSCKISQTIDKDCNTAPVGYKTISWHGTWTGSTQTGTAHDQCLAGGTVTVPCPAQVQLPFFDYLELIGSVIVIGLIYIGLIFKKKIFKKK